MKDLRSETLDIGEVEHVLGTLSMTAPDGDGLTMEVHLARTQHQHIAEFVTRHAGEPITLHLGLPDAATLTETHEPS